MPRLIFAALVVILAACGGPGPTAAPTVPVNATITAGAATPAPDATAAPGATVTADAIATLPPRAAQLTICLAGEPQSLYRYARPEPNRAHILAALYDGPIDQTDGAETPVILTDLPSVDNGEAITRTVSVTLGELVVDALGRVVPLAEGTPLLLADGTVSPYTGDGPVDLPQWSLTFHLRSGLLWSDNAPLTAADSVFAFMLGGDVDSQDPRRAVAERTASYIATDNLTIVWTGLPGYVDRQPDTHFWPPLPQHQLVGMTPGEIADSDLANRAPLGWGAFVIESWTPGSELTLARNPNYWRAAEGLPRVERVVYHFVADAQAQLAALEAGACDLAPSGPGLTALADEATAAGLAAQTVPGPDLALLHFSLEPAPDYDSPGSAAIADRAVREALAHCLDRAALAPAPGLAIADSYERPTPTQAGLIYAFDPERGRAQLAEAGWADSNGDGVVDRDGAPLVLNLVGGPQDNADALTLLSAVQAQLQSNCGVTVNAQPLTRGELFGDWPDGVIFGRRFDLALLTWRVGAEPACALFLGDQIPGDSNPAGANASGYANPRFDAVCRETQTQPGVYAQAAVYGSAASQFIADLPALPLFFWPRTGLARASVSGYVVNGLSDSELQNIEAIAP